MMAHTNIMGFGLPFSLTLPIFILLQRLLIVQVFFQFFIFFCRLIRSSIRLADSNHLKAYGLSSRQAPNAYSERTQIDKRQDQYERNELLTNS